jgi:hypothetical protein
LSCTYGTRYSTFLKNANFNDEFIETTSLKSASYIVGNTNEGFKNYKECTDNVRYNAAGIILGYNIFRYKDHQILAGANLGLAQVTRSEINGTERGAFLSNLGIEQKLNVVKVNYANFLDITTAGFLKYKYSKPHYSAGLITSFDNFNISTDYNFSAKLFVATTIKK